MVLASLPPSELEPGSEADSTGDALPPAVVPPRLMPLLVRTVLLAVAAILLVYAVLPALLRMV